MRVPWPEAFEDGNARAFLEDFEEVAKLEGIRLDRGDNDSYGFCNWVEHEIPMKAKKFRSYVSRRIPLHLKDEVKRQAKQMLKEGIIEETRQKAQREIKQYVQNKLIGHPSPSQSRSSISGVVQLLSGPGGFSLAGTIDLWYVVQMLWHACALLTSPVKLD
ncbi:unnamed protein product [Echinostoma caproni]|uniref:Reverse transcriptase domain-containing protein n=1 Tax=Echinostoma caproni TaxID=27848 RepID=A0A183BG42_9TREM|nr:unnamed protein product [Echinostoma caproni]